jgi:purine-binding chemotaxis protein CheW
MGGRQTVMTDWIEMKRRLQDAQSAVERKFTPSAEETRRVLKARARTLARESAKTEPTDERLEVLEFALADEKYGIESSYVREVFSLKELTALPCTPSFVLGLVNVRGQILSVIDIKKFFDLPDQDRMGRNKVIVVHTDRLELGILADAVLGVSLIPLTDLQPSLPTLTGVRADYLRGVTKEPMVVLDGQKLLSSPKLIVYEELSK